MTPAVDLIVDGSGVAAKALTFPEQAKALSIQDAITYQRACDFLLGIKALRVEIAETFDPHIKRAHEAHKALVKEKQDAEAPLAEAERLTKTAMVAYDNEQARLQREEEQRRTAALRREEEERRLAEAIELEAVARETGDAGFQQQAEALIEAPVHVPTVAVAPLTPKVTGISYRESWSAKVTNVAALIKFVAANPQFANLLTVNQTALNAQARSLKAQMQIPGVEAVCTRDVAAGRR